MLILHNQKFPKFKLDTAQHWYSKPVSQSSNLNLDQKVAKMEIQRFIIIAGLTAVNFLLTELWMSRTKYTYARLLILLVVPIFLLEFLPPRPLRGKHVNPTVRFIAYLAIGILSIVAMVFSVPTWDRDLWIKGVVYVSDPTQLYGMVFSVPYEECIWCVFHMSLAGLWTLSIWESGKPLPKKINYLLGARCMIVIICLGVALIGYSMVESGEKKLWYLGVQLMWVFPIFALQFGVCGHLYLLFAQKYILGVVVPTIYVVVIDTWAIYHDIWGTAEEFVTGLNIFGLIFEQVLVYFLTTMLAVNGMFSFLTIVEFYVAYRPHIAGSPFTLMKRILFW